MKLKNVYALLDLNIEKIAEQLGFAVYWLIAAEILDVDVGLLIATEVLGFAVYWLLSADF